MITNRFVRTGSHLRLNAFGGRVPCRGYDILRSLSGGRCLGSTSTADELFPIVMVGAGNAMFGTVEGPWNHSIRLERKLGQRLQVLGVVEPNADRARAALSSKQSSPNTAPLYANAQVCSRISDLAATNRPRLIVIGSPPGSRGMDVPGRDGELQAIRHFPGVPILVEKPVSTGDIPSAMRVAQELDKQGIVCSVAYNLRYLKAVQRAQEIIQDRNLVIMGTNSRYFGAYATLAKPAWWDKSCDQGPIVEQATHFCDLARYFSGDVDLSTVSARTVEWHERPGALRRMPINESTILPENRIPRATSAIWKYKSGAIGSLTHATILHGSLYACEFEVYCDGYTIRISDPYGVSKLHVRETGQDYEEIETFADDDPFYSEVSNIIDVIEGKAGSSAILSSYQDACRTYELTWAIREASERSQINL